MDGFEEFDSCSICMEAFDTILRPPKLLPCQHTFCKTCLCDMVMKGEGNSVSCPECRNVQPLPSGGWGALPNNLTMLRYIEHKDQLRVAREQAERKRKLSSMAGVVRECMRHWAQELAMARMGCENLQNSATRAKAVLRHHVTQCQAALEERSSAVCGEIDAVVGQVLAKRTGGMDRHLETATVFCHMAEGAAQGKDARISREFLKSCEQEQLQLLDNAVDLPDTVDVREVVLTINSSSILSQVASLGSVALSSGQDSDIAAADPGPMWTNHCEDTVATPLLESAAVGQQSGSSRCSSLSRSSPVSAYIPQDVASAADGVETTLRATREAAVWNTHVKGDTAHAQEEVPNHTNGALGSMTSLGSQRDSHSALPWSATPASQEPEGGATSPVDQPGGVSALPAMDQTGLVAVAIAMETTEERDRLTNSRRQDSNPFSMNLHSRGAVNIDFARKKDSVMEIGKHGKKPCEFNNPCSLAVTCDSSGFFVADSHNKRIQGVSLSGRPMACFGELKGAQGPQSCLEVPHYPECICVDEDANLVCLLWDSDTSVKYIRVYARDGDLLRELDRKCTAGIMRMTLDGGGRIHGVCKKLADVTIKVMSGEGRSVRTVSLDFSHVAELVTIPQLQDENLRGLAICREELYILALRNFIVICDWDGHVTRLIDMRRMRVRRPVAWPPGSGIRGVACCCQGNNILVTDDVDQAVFVLTTEGDLVHKIKDLKRPFAVTVAGEDIIVSDVELHKLFIY